MRPPEDMPEPAIIIFGLGASLIIFESFDCKINSQALEAALQHSFGWLDGRVQSQGVKPGVSESAAVAAGSDRIA